MIDYSKDQAAQLVKMLRDEKAMLGDALDRERRDHEAALGEANREIERLREQVSTQADEILALTYQIEHGGPA